jgi:hypothetical protein
MMAGVVLVQDVGGATLFGNGKTRRWSTWEELLQRALARLFGEDTAILYKLYIAILVGNAHLVQQRADHIRRRRRFRQTWHRLKSALPTTPPGKSTPPSTSPT